MAFLVYRGKCQVRPVEADETEPASVAVETMQQLQRPSRASQKSARYKGSQVFLVRDADPGMFSNDIRRCGKKPALIPLY